ncbi:hypothetical protein DPSP01_003396 [Paraphaeosphaeria sporulosa]
MNLQSSNDTSQQSLYYNKDGKKVTLRANLPVVLEKISKTRTSMLNDVHDACIGVLKVALNEDVYPGRKTHQCASAAVGMLIKMFHEVDMPIYHSHPAIAPSPLQNRLRWYWQHIKQVAGKNKFSDPVPATPYIYDTPCSWDQCTVHLDPKFAVNTNLNKYKHNGLQCDWASVEVCQQRHLTDT